MPDGSAAVAAIALPLGAALLGVCGLGLLLLSSLIAASCLRWRDDAWAWFALGGLAIGLYLDTGREACLLRIDAGREVLLGCCGGRGIEGDQLRLEGDGTLHGSGGKDDTSAEQFVGISIHGNDGEFLAAAGPDNSFLSGILLADDGDSVSTGNRRDSGEGVIIERIGRGRAFHNGRLGGEGTVRPKTGVFARRSLFRDVCGGYCH